MYGVFSSVVNFFAGESRWFQQMKHEQIQYAEMLSCYFPDQSSKVILTAIDQYKNAIFSPSFSLNINCTSIREIVKRIVTIETNPKYSQGLMLQEGGEKFLKDLKCLHEYHEKILEKLAIKVYLYLMSKFSKSDSTTTLEKAASLGNLLLFNFHKHYTFSFISVIYDNPSNPIADCFKEMVKGSEIAFKFDTKTIEAKIEAKDDNSLFGIFVENMKKEAKEGIITLEKGEKKFVTWLEELNKLQKMKEPGSFQIESRINIVDAGGNSLQMKNITQVILEANYIEEKTVEHIINESEINQRHMQVTQLRQETLAAYGLSEED